MRGEDGEREGERGEGREEGGRGRRGRKDGGGESERGVMYPSHFHLLFIFIEMKFYSFSFLCDVCSEVHEHMQ